MAQQCWPPGGRLVYLALIVVKLVLTLALACVVWWSRRNKLPGTWPLRGAALRALIDACWSKEPHNRPTMEAVHDAVAAIPKIDRRSGMLSSPLP